MDRNLVQARISCCLCNSCQLNRELSQATGTTTSEPPGVMPALPLVRHSVTVHALRALASTFGRPGLAPTVNSGYPKGTRLDYLSAFLLVDDSQTIPSLRNVNEVSKSEKDWGIDYMRLIWRFVASDPDLSG